MARRRFLLAAAAGAAGVAMPQVSRAQTAIWRFQSAWASRDIFHEFAADYAKRVEEMTGGRLKFDVLAAGSVVPVFQMQDAVHAGILDGGHGVCDTGTASTRPPRCSAARRHSAGMRTACSRGSTSAAARRCTAS